MVDWVPSLKFEVPGQLLDLVPTKTLYEFDGPQLFCADFGFIHSIFVRVHDSLGAVRFVAATVDHQTIDLIESNRLSVRGAFASDVCWLIETNASLRVMKYWSLRKGDFPENLLPKAGRALALGSPRVPDTIEQARAYFSIAFRGAAVAGGRMPFSALRELVDSAYKVTRRVLLPEALRSTRSGTFDMEVEPTIGSLIISVQRPTFNINRISQVVDEKLTRDEIDAQIRGNVAEFFSEFSEAIDDVSGAQGVQASARTDVLRKYRDIIPDGYNTYESIEFSAAFQNQTNTIFIDSDLGVRLHQAFDSDDMERATRAGKIVEINAKSNSFQIAGRAKRVVTCYASPHVFDDRLMRIGNHATVTGDFRRRPRRDLMFVNAYTLSADR